MKVVWSDDAVWALENGSHFRSVGIQPLDAKEEYGRRVAMGCTTHACNSNSPPVATVKLSQRWVRARNGARSVGAPRVRLRRRAYEPSLRADEPSTRARNGAGTERRMHRAHALRCTKGVPRAPRVAGVAGAPSVTQYRTWPGQEHRSGHRHRCPARILSPSPLSPFCRRPVTSAVTGIRGRW
jgi:hypothetical protein